MEQLFVNAVVTADMELIKAEQTQEPQEDKDNPSHG